MQRTGFDPTPTPAEPALAAVRVNYFQLDTRLKLGRTRIASLMVDERIDDHDVLIFGNSYDVEGKRYYASAIANSVPRQPDILEVQMVLGTTAALMFRHEGAKPASYLLDLLERMQAEGTVRCGTYFSYPSKSWASMVKLPMDFVDLPAMPFDEIRGFRAVKFANGKKTKYSIVVDRAENRDYHHSVAFSSDVAIRQTMVELMLREAVSISRQFIRPREPRGRTVK